MSNSTHHTPSISFGKIPEDKVNHSRIQTAAMFVRGWLARAVQRSPSGPWTDLKPINRYDLTAVLTVENWGKKIKERIKKN